MAVGLSVDQGRLLNGAVSDLIVKAEAEGAILCDDAGNVLAQAAMGQASHVQTIAALGAGSFAATRELAAMIGEKSFQSIHHQGEKANIYVRSVASVFFILVVFEKKTTAGLVKLYVERMSEEIRPTLRQVAAQTCEAAGGNFAAFELDSTVRPPYQRSPAG